MQVRNLAHTVLAVALVSLFVVGCGGGGAAAAQPDRPTGPSMDEPANIEQPTIEDAGEPVAPPACLGGASFRASAWGQVSPEGPGPGCRQ